jgi:putative endopeptidase
MALAKGGALAKRSAMRERTPARFSCSLVLVVSLIAALAAPGARGQQRPPAPAAGLDLAGMDRAVNPGDDFFAYANGGWIKRTAIPPDKARWGVFGELAEQTDHRTRELLEAASQAPAGTPARQAGDYYASFMDEAGIEARGTAPLKPALDRIARLKDKRALARLLGEELRADVDPLNSTNFHTSRLFGLWVSLDVNAPDRYVPYLLQGGLGLPDREYYLDTSVRMAEIRTKYQQHIAAMFALAGVADGPARAAGVVSLETAIAKAHGSRQDSMEVRKGNNPWPRAQLPRRAPGLDWPGFLRAAGLDRAPTIVVWHPAATKGIAALVASVPLQAWKDWLAFHAIDRAARVLPRAFVERHFAFHDQALSGTPQLAARWKRGVLATNEALGDVVGQLFVQRWFPPASKLQVQEMVKLLVAAFSRRIDEVPWMAPATKASAKAKLATLYVGIGYPERWRDYRGLRVVRGDPVGNLERAERFEYQRSVARLGTPVDRTEWCMTPQTVNAVNLPVQNALDFPAAILQPPFFDPRAPAAANYGAIGAVIGHEISHSFDDQGAEFDAHGKLADWWTKEDRAHFEAAGAQLVRQYDAYRPFPDLHVNGRLTLSENIADLAGLAAAHDAWRAALRGRPAPVVHGMTGEQQLFVAYAQAWRAKAREAALRRRIITDGHAPPQYRAYTVRNLDNWYTAFGIKPGQKLFLAPKNRVRVW